jgi:hypothetical protein
VDARPTALVDPSGVSATGTNCSSLGDADTAGLPIAVWSGAANFAQGVDRVAASGDAALEQYIRSLPHIGEPWKRIGGIPRAAEVFLRRAIPALSLASFVYDVCAYRSQGSGWRDALGRSAFANGGALAGATALPLPCLALLPTGWGAVACAGGLAVVGGLGGHELGERAWDRISRLF